MGNTSANRAWKVINGLRVHNKDTAGLNLIILEKWKEYYKDLMMELRSKFLESEEEIATEEIQKPEITVKEIKEVLFKMKNRRVPGLGNVNIKLLKKHQIYYSNFGEKFVTTAIQGANQFSRTFFI